MKAAADCLPPANRRYFPHSIPISTFYLSFLLSSISSILILIRLFWGFLPIFPIWRDVTSEGFPNSTRGRESSEENSRCNERWGAENLIESTKAKFESHDNQSTNSLRPTSSMDTCEFVEYTIFKLKQNNADGDVEI